MKTKLTVIVDNMSNNELKGEWGLSILCEHEGKKILADVGGSELFADNLKALGFDIAEIDYAALSHAHYDHANGMARFFAENSKAKFYIRETTAENCYYRVLFFIKYIGIPKKVMSRFADRIEIVSGDYMLCDGVYLIPHKTSGLEKIGKRERIYQKIERRYIPDNFSHEQSVVLDTNKGLVIINSCSHGGAANIIKEVKATFPNKHVYGLIGGFHLYNKSEEFVRATAKAISDLGIDFICTGHCTGERSYRVLKEELGDKVTQLRVGLQMEF
jgi:7,8-dihydropterin-6-yl-methyl-4-(beta-D-ribofuranosyl)aminobenzene 5'-phosphate synthase